MPTQRPILAYLPALALMAAAATEPEKLSAQEKVQAIDPKASEGYSTALIVPDLPLLHTTQFLPLDGQGNVVHKGNAQAQINDVLDKIDSTVGLNDPKGKTIVVKLHVVAASLDAAEEFRRALPKWHSAVDHPDLPAPTITFVVGKLRHPDALIGVDAVLTCAGANRPAGVVRTPETGRAVAAVLEPGPKIYVSGQAERGTDLGEMTRRTMQSLGTTLKHLELEPSDVVQVKSFLSPIEAVDECEHEIAAFFGGEKLAPPQVFVEWTSPPSIEIELIASAKNANIKATDTAEFVTPPGMVASPVFSRVGWMAAGPSIYVSGLHGLSQRDGEQETIEVFEQLGKLLGKAGSDFRHLVKATYYVASDDASTKLNVLRPRYYDPKRPPAASKAPVSGTGREWKTITLDMIAAPAR